jgi:hypothetical protein
MSVVFLEQAPMYRWKSAAQNQNQNQNKFRKSFRLKKFQGKKFFEKL